MRKEVESSAGALLIRIGRKGARGLEVGALPLHGRHARGTRRPFEAFHRAAGGYRCGHGGAQVWASYGPIWFMGPKQSLFTSACSTFFIKALWSFEQYNSG